MTRLVMKDIPEARLQQSIADFKNEHMKVITIPENDGQWPITAIPDDDFDATKSAGGFQAPAVQG